MLKTRQKSILEAAIGEYIRTAKPVASRNLVDRYDFDISPATIRNCMLELDHSGYLEQPYTSAGRIPTDKGYRFFVDYLVKETSLTAREQRLIDKLFDTSEEDEFIHELGRVVARMSHTFTAVANNAHDVLYETGFSEVLHEPEFEDPDEVRTFGRLVDMLNENMADIHDTARENPHGEHTFIGGENPWKEAEAYAVTISSWSHPRGFNGFLTRIGPKRTNYKKHKALSNYLRNYDE